MNNFPFRIFFYFGYFSSINFYSTWHQLRQLEEIRGCSRSSKSSCASTPSSGALTSDGQTSSVDLSPKSLEKHQCRPIADVRTETEVKGSLMERLVQVEVRLLKVRNFKSVHPSRQML